MKLVIKNTNAESFGAPINPYNGNHDIEENEKRKDFAQAYPSLLILKDNQPVGEGWSGDVTGVHWQMRMNRDLVEAGIDKELKWKTINVYDGMDLNEPFYRPVYLVAEPVEKQDICIVCDESTTHKSFCADCGLNKADERPTPPQSDTIEERAAKAGKEYYAKDKPANTYTFHSGFIAGATSEREIMSREVVAQGIKSTQLEFYAQQKALDYLRRHFATQEDHTAPDDEFIELHQTEYDTCMDLFIAGYRFSKNLYDFEQDFSYTHPD